MRETAKACLRELKIVSIPLRKFLRVLRLVLLYFWDIGFHPSKEVFEV